MGVEQDGAVLPSVVLFGVFWEGGISKRLSPGTPSEKALLVVFMGTTQVVLFGCF